MAECGHYLNALDGFLLTARVVRDRVTNLFKKFSAQNNSEKKLSGEGGVEPAEHDTLLALNHTLF